VKDWIDDVLDDEECSMWQIGFIEQLLITSASNYLYFNIDFNNLTHNEAEKIIKDLRENNCPSDSQEQFKEMCRAGVFKPKEY
jgi:hypothetical protein